MPIRTNRGRAAVYRRLWGWPMRSPRHLVATVLVIAAIVLTVGLIVPKLTGADKASQGGAANIGGTASTSQGGATNPGSSTGAGAVPPPGQTTSAPPTSLSNRQTAPVQTPTSAPPAAKALDIAVQWVKAWVNHPEGVTTEQWLNGLKPLTTEEQIAVMSTVDPRNIQATAVTGEPTVKVSYTTSVEAIIPTNAGSLDITVIATPEGWRVAKYEQAA
jgi:hypothetical protein